MTDQCFYQCVGGALPVNGAYVDAQMRKLPEGTNEETRRSIRAALENSVSPCPVCRPDQYDLWRNGHLESGHTCESCVARRKGKRSRAA